MSRCQRCGAAAHALTGSYFDTALVCLTCEARERAHPEFEYARSAEDEAVRQGDYNFPGIGLPADLQPAERCPVCGQPDNCGDCTHEPPS